MNWVWKMKMMKKRRRNESSRGREKGPVLCLFKLTLTGKAGLTNSQWELHKEKETGSRRHTARKEAVIVCQGPSVSWRLAVIPFETTGDVAFTADMDWLASAWGPCSCPLIPLAKPRGTWP